MVPFTYVRADKVESAVSGAAGLPGAKFLAGGTNLIDLMKDGIERPPRLIDVAALPLAKIEPLEDGGLRLGAMARNSDVAEHRLVRERYPMLSQALLSGASPQLRNMATVGGNLLQRTRCPYFLFPAAPCNKREPGSGCSARAGDDRSAAVLGTSDQCICAHPSDMCVALAALGAVVRTRGPRGERAIAFDDFHLLPGKTPQRESAIEQGELIIAVDLPHLPLAAHSLYLKVRDRGSFAFALASAAIALEIRGGVVRGARVALGGVGTVPWRAQGAEKVLVGARANEKTFRAAADAALNGARAGKHNGFKIELARRVVVRALKALARGA